MMNISLVIPLFNEEESLSELCTQIYKVMEQNNFSYEVILIDDCSDDNPNAFVTLIEIIWPPLPEGIVNHPP